MRIRSTLNIFNNSVKYSTPTRPGGLEAAAEGRGAHALTVKKALYGVLIQIKKQNLFIPTVRGIGGQASSARKKSKSFTSTARGGHRRETGAIPFEITPHLYEKHDIFLKWFGAQRRRKIVKSYTATRDSGNNGVGATLVLAIKPCER